MGSNIEPRKQHLLAAIDELRARLAPSGSVLAVSSFLETQALVPPGQPAGPPYLNGACLIETSRSPGAMLDLCLEVERAQGRLRVSEARWGPRTLDLDLLLWGEQEVHEPGLDIPHPRMLERLFVLEPLAEIAADWVVPGTGKSVRSHRDALRAKVQGSEA